MDTGGKNYTLISTTGGIYRCKLNQPLAYSTAFGTEAMYREGRVLPFLPSWGGEQGVGRRGVAISFGEYFARCRVKKVH